MCLITVLYEKERLLNDHEKTESFCNLVHKQQILTNFQYKTFSIYALKKND